MVSPVSLHFSFELQNKEEEKTEAIDFQLNMK